jgi:hypothetical protein
MMQRLSLDIVKSPVPVWPGIVLLIIGGGCLMAAYLQHLGTSEHNTMLQKKLTKAGEASLQQQTASQSSTLTPEEVAAQDHRAREIASFLLLPWRDFFAAIESASQDDVALLAIEPDHKKNHVRITAEAKNFDILIAYLRRLGNAPQLKLVRLLRYEVREDDKQHPIRFTVEASWRLSL